MLLSLLWLHLHPNYLYWWYVQGIIICGFERLADLIDGITVDLWRSVVRISLT
jgi:hypothetical protein